MNYSRHLNENVSRVNANSTKTSVSHVTRKILAYNCFEFRRNFTNHVIQSNNATTYYSLCGRFVISIKKSRGGKQGALLGHHSGVCTYTPRPGKSIKAPGQLDCGVSSPGVCLCSLLTLTPDRYAVVNGEQSHQGVTSRLIWPWFLEMNI